MMYTTEQPQRGKPRYLNTQFIVKMERERRAELEAKWTKALGFPVVWNFWNGDILDAETGEMVGHEYLEPE